MMANARTLSVLQGVRLEMSGGQFGPSEASNGHEPLVRTDELRGDSIAVENAQGPTSVLGNDLWSKRLVRFLAHLEIGYVTIAVSLEIEVPSPVGFLARVVVRENAGEGEAKLQCFLYISVSSLLMKESVTDKFVR